MIFVEMRAFARRREEFLDDDSYRDLQATLLADPYAGAQIHGTRMLRKLRWAMPGHGKRGGVRVIYTVLENRALLLLLLVYQKNEQERSLIRTEEDLERVGRTGDCIDGRCPMNDELFNELVNGIKEAGAYLRGEPADVRVTFMDEPDPRAIRDRMGMTQERFADLLCISVKTLRNWEQGRREPSGPAMRLLQIADKHPEILLDALKPQHGTAVPLPPGRALR